MNDLVKINLALMQVNNLSSLLEGNEYENFFNSHLISVKVELERQIYCLTNTNHCTKIKE
jgi:hypothetical protein